MLKNANTEQFNSVFIICLVPKIYEEKKSICVFSIIILTQNLW